MSYPKTTVDGSQANAIGARRDNARRLPLPTPIVFKFSKEEELKRIVVGPSIVQM